MHVALFISSLHTGGTQRQITLTATGMAQRGVGVHLLSIYPGGEFWQQASTQPNIRFVALFETRPVTRVMRALGLLWAPVRLRHFLSMAQPDVLYSMLDLSNLIARLATFGKQVPLLVWGIRASVLQPDYRAAIPYWLCKQLSGTVPLHIANSQKGLAAYKQDRFQICAGAVVHNGIDTDQFKFDASGRQALRRQWGVDEEAIVITLVGRFDQRKGHGVFLRMAARLNRSDARLRFVCVGPGTRSVKSQLADLAAAIGLGNTLLMLEDTRDMSNIYSASDIVVSASTGEGFPNVIGEAMACGRACVVTDVGDSAILVGDCGVVVEPDDEHALADAVSNAITKQEAMGQCGRIRIQTQFSVDIVVSNTLEVLNAALARS